MRPLEIVKIKLSSSPKFCADLDTLTTREPSLAISNSISNSVKAMEHPRLGRLSAVMSTVLERNVDSETVVRFKRHYLDSLPRLVEVTSAATGLGSESALKILRSTYFPMIGMVPAAHPAPAVREALSRPELAPICISFDQHFAELLVATIGGLRAEESRAIP